ncbi:MAG: hypothetical protein II716_12320 [Treponema sp.]|nr:hypothetical protein [Treponema sp.]MBQ5384050.1 hypothetical protein [Treponema sp.]
MNFIQEEISKALVQLSEKSILTEAIIAKKIRENINLSGKNKAGLSFRDVEEAVYYIEENNSLHYALHLNSANDLLLKPSESACGLDGDARKRRLSSEKSRTLLTNADVKNVGDGKNKREKKNDKTCKTK